MGHRLARLSARLRVTSILRTRRRRAPHSPPRPATPYNHIPPSVLEAAEKGMMGENASSGHWTPETASASTCGRSAWEVEMERWRRAKGTEGLWDGWGSDGMRHVRWKGVHA